MKYRAQKVKYKKYKLNWNKNEIKSNEIENEKEIDFNQCSSQQSVENEKARKALKYWK